jgi:hypothetical protein
MCPIQLSAARLFHEIVFSIALAGASVGRSASTRKNIFHFTTLFATIWGKRNKKI